MSAWRSVCPCVVYIYMFYVYVYSYIYSLSACFPFESCAVTHCYLCRYRQQNILFFLLLDGIEFTPAKETDIYSIALYTQFHYLRCKIITVYSINFALDFFFLSLSLYFPYPVGYNNSIVMFARLFFCRGNKRNITPIIVNVYLNTWRWQWNDYYYYMYFIVAAATVSAAAAVVCCAMKMNWNEF